MDWPNDTATNLLDQIERTVKQRLTGSKKSPRVAEDILESVQYVRSAISGGDTEEIFAAALALGMDVGHAGYKEFGLREFLNRSGRRPGEKKSRDEAIFEAYLTKRGTSKMSPTALMTKIGKQHGVGRTRAIEIIRARLAPKPKKLSGKQN